MNEHLTLNEIMQALNKSPESLASNRYMHFKACEKCQRAYKTQQSADMILKSMRPKPVGAVVLEKVLNKIEHIVPAKIKEKTDWTFLIAMVLLFSIGSWFIFSGKAESYIQNYAPQLVTEQEKVRDFTIIDSMREFFSGLNVDFPEYDFGNFYLALGIFAILFYMFIDRKISHILKVHKT